ncbi:prolyl 4-hydroxylase subunit alpha-2 [Drosophila biarmipes]|uniref:prolyl 4-hydroxylase subunit alpha-2 n=1 Tax=Drosophila biarmipes TaxID=125945 RepID=UPI0021CCB92D|nr:prolyl 4-hydroxylase subunit alpha-2 [Drosophila biarmipes]
MQMPMAFSVLWLLQLFLLMKTAVGAHLARGEEQLEALLATETQLIDELRDNIERLELQLAEIQRETSAIAEIHGQVDNVEEFMGNPLNVLGILKRFESVWPRLEQQANETLLISSEGSSLERDFTLTLPSEEDYEESLNHLLHLQSVYELDPSSLSLGLVNGLKLGSAMSWGDCLEMARKSDFAVARFWLESALEKLPSASENSTESQRERESGRVHILEAALNIEYRAGELARALATAEQLLVLLPMNQNIQKAKRKIEKAMAKKELPKGRRPKSKTKKSKSAEQLLIEELCRGATQEPNTGSRFRHCELKGSRPWLLLQPSRLEPLSSDPYVVLHHDVLTPKESAQLLELIDEEDTNAVGSYQPLKLSKLAQKKLKKINHLGLETGELDAWTGRRHGHEHSTKLEDSSQLGNVARVMLNLQPPGMGGAVVFPQLELAVNVPRGSLLHWHTRSAGGSSSDWDYRSGQAVCPVLLGAQLSVIACQHNVMRHTL